MKFETLRDMIVETLGCSAELVKPEASLAEDLGADSLAAMELIMALEEASGITVSEEDAVRLKTVGDILAFLEQAKR